jgi:hypothetical protein
MNSTRLQVQTIAASSTSGSDCNLRRASGMRCSESANLSRTSSGEVLWLTPAKIRFMVDSFLQFRLLIATVAANPHSLEHCPEPIGWHVTCQEFNIVAFKRYAMMRPVSSFKIRPIQPDSS